MEEALIKRVMPHSVEAEQSVVGAMLMDKDAITTASEIISGQDFYQTSYGVVFDSMVELFNEGKPVDLVITQLYNLYVMHYTPERKRCTAGDFQSGICKGSGQCSTDLCKCKILCGDRGR